MAEKETKSLRVLVAMEAAALEDLQTLMVGLQPGNQYGVEIAGVARDGTVILEQAIELDADAVLLSPNVPGYTPELIQRLLHNPERPILTVAVVPGVGDWAVTTEQAGAVAHLNTPLTDASLAKLASLLPAEIRDAYAHRASDSYVPRLSQEVAQIVDRGGWQKQSVCFWSPAGGVGKTTLSVNVAAALGVVANKRVLLADADMNKGDAHLLLNMAGGEEKNIFALAKYNELHYQSGFNANDVKRYTVPYGSTNLWVMKGIMQTYMASEPCLADEAIGSTFVNRLLGATAPAYDFVIFDMGQTYNHPVHLTLLRQANIVFLIVNSTITSLNSAHRSLGVLKQAGLLGSDRLRVLVNKFHPSHGIGRKEVQKALRGQPIFAEIAAEQEQEVVQALNDGEPLVLSRPKCDVAQDILQVAGTLYPPLLEIKKLQAGGKSGGILDGLSKWIGG